MSFYFADKTWEELQTYIERDAVILLPVGTTEEHGFHLPVSTDTTIAEGFARAAAAAVEDELPILVMPAVWAGYSPKAMGKWPGTMMVGTKAFMAYVHDICASLVAMGFRKIVMLDCHGQHAALLNTVTKEIADEYGAYLAVTSPLVFSLAEFNKIRRSGRGGVLHACEWETSVMLLFSRFVKMDKAVDTDIMRYHSDFVAGDSAMGGQKVTWSTWGLQESETGVYGDPTVASEETGQIILDAAVENYRKFLHEYHAFGAGTGGEA